LAEYLEETGGVPGLSHDPREPQEGPAGGGTEAGTGTTDPEPPAAPPEGGAPEA
jgi:hypothetical protein